MNKGFVIDMPQGFTMRGANRRVVGAKGDIINNGGDGYVFALAPGSSLYNADGTTVYYTNSGTTTIQPGGVVGVIDAGNGQYMLQIDTGMGLTPLNIGVAYSKPVSPGTNDAADVLQYFQAQSGSGAQASTNTPGSGGDASSNNNSGGINPLSPFSGGWWKGPGFGPLTMAETWGVGIFLGVMGLITINQVTK